MPYKKYNSCFWLLQKYRKISDYQYVKMEWRYMNIKIILWYYVSQLS